MDYCFNQLLKNSQPLYSLAILTVTDRVDEHEANFATDYIKIQALALQNKKLKEIEKWQNTKIDDTYIKIANEYKGCEFFSNWLKF